MGVKSYDDIVSRISAGFWLSQPCWGEVNASTASVFLGNNLMSFQMGAWSKVMPSPLPTGVASYFVTRSQMSSSTAALTYLLAKVINLGSLDIAGPTFTDGNSMPTVTELGASVTAVSPVLVEVTTALNSTPGSVQITYVDQDGNTAEANTAQTMAASSAVQSVGWAILNTGDWGVRDITTATRTGGTTPTGVVKFWGVIPIAFAHLSSAVAQYHYAENLVTSGFNLPKLGAGDELRVFIVGSVTAKVTVGDLFVVGDST